MQSASVKHWSDGVWHWYVAPSAQHRATVPGAALGEQSPPGPQSESTVQPLPVTHTLGDGSVSDERHEQGTAGQSESMRHSS